MKHCCICPAELPPKYEFMACRNCRGICQRKGNREQKFVGSIAGRVIWERVYRV